MPYDKESLATKKIEHVDTHMSGTRGNPIIVDDDGGQDFTTIQDAVNASHAGDTIHVWAGTYNENVLINKTLTLIGNGGSDTIIDAEGNGDVVLITANWVNLTGFNITNSGSQYLPDRDAGIDIKSYYNNITNCVVHHNYFGIYLDGGFQLSESSYNVVDNNRVFSNEKTGIRLHWSNYNRISNNTCWNNDYNGGIGESLSKCNLIENNFCYSNIGAGGIYSYSGEKTIIRNNRCMDNTNSGIIIENHCEMVLIYNNYCNNNDIGINCRRNNYISHHCSILSNVIDNNTGVGIQFYDRMWENNTVHHNVLKNNNGNNVQAKDNGFNNTWNNSFDKGNYWSDYLTRYPNSNNNGYVWNISYTIPGTACAHDNYSQISSSCNQYPILINDYTNSNGTTGDRFEFNLSILNDATISTVTIMWSHGNSSGNINLNLSETNYFGISRWCGSIFLHDDLGNLTYNVSVIDNSGKYILNNKRTVNVRDNDRPLFGTKWNSTVTTGDSALFTINITENIGVDQLMFNFIINRGQSFNWSVNNNTENMWSITIVIPDNAFSFEYYFWVNDTSNNQNKTISDILSVVDNDIPFIISDDTDSTGTTGEPLTFSTHFSDNIGLDPAKVYVIWFYDFGENPLTSSMSYLGQYAWQFTIGAVRPNATVIYYGFLIYDISGNSYSTDPMNPGIVTISDNDKPIFGREETIGLPTTGDPYTILLDASDNIGVTSVSVRYTFDSISYQSDIMNLDNEGLWNTSITIPSDAIHLIYRFYISDKAGNILNTGKPQKVVLDNDAPWLIEDETTDIPKTGEKFNISVNVKDNIGVTVVDVNYTFDGENYETEHLTRISGDTWSGNFKVDMYAISVNYSFIVSDDASNKLITIETKALVTDVISPVAQVGVDIIIDQHQEVTFNGTNSSDNIDIEEFIWNFTYNGIEKTLKGKVVDFTFHIPGIYPITLNISDKEGNWAADFLNITVRDITPPVAVAGNDIVIDQGQLVSLNGSGSYDNVLVINHTWTIIFDDIEKNFYGSSPSFTFDEPGTYYIILNITDSAGNWHSDHLNVTVRDSTVPTAIAGEDITIDEGDVVVLTGTGSKDNVGIMNYTWSFLYNNSNVLLYGPKPSFVFNIPGNYTIDLKVRDKEGNDAADTLNIVVIAAWLPNDDDDTDDDTSEQSATTSSQLPFWITIPLIIFALIVGVLIVLIIIKRKRKNILFVPDTETTDKAERAATLTPVRETHRKVVRRRVVTKIVKRRMLDVPSLICPTCDQFAQYYAEYECFWCEGCQDYVSPEEKSTGDEIIEPTESVEESPKEEIPPSVVENEHNSSIPSEPAEIVPESEVQGSSPILESSQSTDGD